MHYIKSINITFVYSKLHIRLFAYIIISQSRIINYEFVISPNFNKTLIEIPEGERQDLRPVAYIRNGSIYACRRDMLVKGKRYGTQNSHAYIMDDNNSVNIDTKRDLLLAKILLKK